MILDLARIFLRGYGWHLPYKDIPLLNISRSICRDYIRYNTSKSSFSILQNDTKIFPVIRGWQYKGAVNHPPIQVSAILVYLVGLLNCSLNTCFTSSYFWMFGNYMVVPRVFCTNNGYAIFVRTPKYFFTPIKLIISLIKKGVNTYIGQGLQPSCLSRNIGYAYYKVPNKKPTILLCLKLTFLPLSAKLT